MVGGSLTSPARAGATDTSASEARMAGESSKIRRIMFPPTMLHQAKPGSELTLLLKTVRHVGLGERRGARLHPAVEESLFIGRTITLGVVRPNGGQHFLPLVE